MMQNPQNDVFFFVFCFRRKGTISNYIAALKKVLTTENQFFYRLSIIQPVIYYIHTDTGKMPDTVSNLSLLILFSHIKKFSIKYPFT